MPVIARHPSTKKYFVKGQGFVTLDVTLASDMRGVEIEEFILTYGAEVEIKKMSYKRWFKVFLTKAMKL